MLVYKCYAVFEVYHEEKENLFFCSFQRKGNDEAKETAKHEDTRDRVNPDIGPYVIPHSPDEIKHNSSDDHEEG